MLYYNHKARAKEIIMTKELKEKIMNHLAEAEFEMFNFMDETANHDYEEIREELKKVMEKFYKAN